MRSNPTPVHELVRYAEFMRSLARALLWDESAADDAVQDTWLAALQHPPRHMSTARAWLGKVLRNRARERHRLAMRRIAREQACARPDACAAAGDVVARQEVINLVARAVSALDEPGRSTVILRHFDGLPPREIAREMHCPVETVKSRLKRAHEQLRHTLGSGDPQWRTALVPLTGLELATTSSGAMSSTLGALAVTKKLGLALSVVIVAVMGHVGWRAVAGREAAWDEVPQADPRASGTMRDPSNDEVPVLRGISRDHATAGRETSGVVRGEGAASTSPGGAPEGASSPGPGDSVTAPIEVIAGVVTVGAFPAREGTVRIVGAPLSDGLHLGLVRIDGDGRFQVLPKRVGAVQLSIEVPGHQARTVSVHAGSPNRDPIRVAFGIGSISGVVQGADGAPASDVPVRLASYLALAEERYVPSADGDVFGIHVRTATDGTYAFTDLPAGRYVVVAEPVKGGQDARNIRSFPVELGAGERRRLDIGGPRHDPTWSGTVRYEDGSPVLRAGSLFMASQDGQRRLYVGFDAEGVYAQPVPQGTYRMEFVFPAPKPGESMRLVRTDRVVEIPAGGAREDVVLPGSRIAGRVLGWGATTGGPKTAQSVVFTLESSEGALPKSLIASWQDRPVAVAPVAEDGTFGVDGLLPGLWTVTGSPLPLVAEDGRPARLTLRAGARPQDLHLLPAPRKAGDGETPVK